MRTILLTVLGLLLTAATTARADAPREVEIARGLNRYSAAPVYSQSPYYAKYTSPYYYRGGFLSPYVHRTPATPRYFGSRSYLFGGIGAGRYDGIGRYDRYDYDGDRRFGDARDRFDHARVDRFHRPYVSPQAPGARLHIPRAVPRVAPPPVGVRERTFFRDGANSGASHRGGSGSGGGTMFRGGASGGRR